MFENSEHKSKEKILVTGATGFVGSWMARFLVEKGHTVSILKRPKGVFPFKDVLVDVKTGDVTDLDSLLEATKNVDSVFHLAGVVGFSKAQRQLMEDVNVSGSENIIKACLENKIRRVVHFSSVVAVGAGFNKNEVLNEESPFNVSHLDLGYFETKRKSEELFIEAVKTKGLDGVMVNPSVIYGAGDGLKGSRKTQMQVIKGKLPFYTKGGVSIISIHDVVKAAYQAFLTGRKGERYILSGDNLTIKEFLTMIAKEAGVKPPRIFIPTFVIHTLGRLGDLMEKQNKKFVFNSETAWKATMYHWFDSTKAQKELKLKPSSAQTAISESIQWMKDNHII